MSFKKVYIAILLGLVFQVPLSARNLPNSKPASKIQLCLIIDVSGSMDGLLYQAQTQVWSLLDYAQSFTKKKRKTVVEVALITVGNGAMFEGQDYINLVSPFTAERDTLADRLFLLKIEGSSEQYGNAIQLALTRLEWDEKSKFRSIIVLGNESFDQGDVSYLEVCRKAAAKDIVINTIFCGEEKKGIEEKWLHASELGGGDYAYIDQTSQANLATPFDRQIFRLYNNYLLSYGDSTMVKARDRLKGDEISPAYRDMLLYRLDQQEQEKDVIDHFEESNWDLSKIEPGHIPEELLQLGNRAMKEYLVKKAQERNNARDGLSVYRNKINWYIETQAKEATQGTTLKDAAEEILGKQLKARRFKKPG
ncbi:MAG: VWA domain-containing protein [Roseivirga sp.]|nr:VWA domain-containing protein [Roseivirga sp.]